MWLLTSDSGLEGLPSSHADEGVVVLMVDVWATLRGVASFRVGILALVG